MVSRCLLQCRSTTLLVLLFQLCLWAATARAQKKVPPYDLWNDQVLAAIRDRSTLEESVVAHLGYFDVFFTSNPAANWYEAEPPYGEHRGEKIRIHGFLASPLAGGPYPALVLGHGHGGKADRDLTLLIASFGYVVLFIDGPQAGQSTGGPEDKNQAWISVDSGPQYGYLFHYAYAGMRALTLVETLAGLPGNPFRIDASKLGVLGASMGGIFTTLINGIDNRVKAAIIIASAGNWQHTLRYPNSWLYHGMSAGTRDIPYNGSDPLNSIEDIDSDPTAITFINYFDPIRYAPRQRAPVLTVIGTHDQYFPLPSANLMELAIESAGIQASFEKRLWLLPNAPHRLDTAAGIEGIVVGLHQWLDYAFGKRQRPLASPTISLVESGGALRFEVTVPDLEDRPLLSQAAVYAATRIDSTVTPIGDFKEYPATLVGGGLVAQLPAGEKSPSGDLFTPENVIYFATVTDAAGLAVSSLAYKGRVPMDLSTGFIPVIDHFPGDSVNVPPPPASSEPAITLAASVPVLGGSAYQGMALANSSTETMVARVEARTTDGRIAAAEGLVNPSFMILGPRAQQVFLAEEWLGAGARQLAGSFRVVWSRAQSGALAFRGNVAPPALDGIGPLRPAPGPLWLPLSLDVDPSAIRRIKIFSTSPRQGASGVVVFRNRLGDIIEMRLAGVSAQGVSELSPPSGSGLLEPASAEFRFPSDVAARLEVSGAGDPWSIEAQPAPASTRFIQPHIEWNGVFTTTFVILNPTSAVVAAAIRLHTTSGGPAASSVVQLVQPGGVASVTAESLPGIGPTAPRGAGWLEIEANGGPLLITAVAVDGRTRAAAASTLEPQGAGPWSLPFYVESEGYYTGLALANTGTAGAGIAITAYDAAGGVQGSAQVTLAPGESRTALVFQWIPGLPAGSTGHLTISSTSPLALLSYFGTGEGASLAAIPFTPLPP